MKRCKYFDKCDFVQPEGYTCNHEDEAKDFCGIHRDVDLGKVERLRKFDTDPQYTDHDWVDWSEW